MPDVMLVRYVKQVICSVKIATVKIKKWKFSSDDIFFHLPFSASLLDKEN